MYTATFKIGNNSYSQDKMSVVSGLQFDEAFVTSRMEDTKRKHPADNLNVAYQILLKYPDAYNIIVVNNGKAVLALLLFIFMIFFGPIIFAFYMHNKPKKGNLFRNVQNIEQFKKFRKILIIIGSITYGLIAAFIVVCAIVLKDLLTMSLYILFGFDIAYLLVGVLGGNSIYKKYHVEEEIPESSGEQTSSFENNITTSEQEEVQISSDEKIEKLREYKKLLDEGVITKAEFNAMKAKLMGDMGVKTKTPIKLGIEWLFIGLSLLALVFIFVWWCLPVDYMILNLAWFARGYKGTTFFESFAAPLGWSSFPITSIIGFGVALAGLIAYIVVLNNKKKIARIITSSISLVGVITCVVNHIIMLTYNQTRYDVFYYTTQASIAEAISFGVATICGVMLVVLSIFKSEDKPLKKGLFGIVFSATTVAVIAAMTLTTAFIKTPDDITEQRNSVFNFESVTLESGETGLSITRYKGNETNLVIPDSINGKRVVKIGSGALGSYSNHQYIKSIYVPRGVKEIGYDCFGGCINLESITLPFIGETEPNEGWISGGDVFGRAFGQSMYDSNEYNVPTSLKTVTVLEGTTIISSDAFKNCGNIETINLPESITTIRDGAFLNCGSLSSLNISSNIRRVGEKVFNGCDSLNYVEFNNALYVGNPSNRYAVLVKAKNTEITECTVNNNCKAITGGAFDKCNKLESLDISGSVKYINSYTVNSLKYLTTLNLRYGVQTIDYDAFFNCYNLVNVTFPRSLKNIGSSIFQYCNGLIELTFLGTIDEWNSIERGYNWKGDQCQLSTIHCSNGDVSC